MIEAAPPFGTVLRRVAFVETVEGLKQNALHMVCSPDWTYTESMEVASAVLSHPQPAAPACMRQVSAVLSSS